MGKKKVIEKTGDQTKPTAKASLKAPKKKGVKNLEQGRIYIKASYNNTSVTVTDDKGNVVAWASAGGTGFSGPKKATPFAASKVIASIMEKISKTGPHKVDIYVSGVGSGRDSAVRTLATQELDILSIKDINPIAHNGPRPKKLRRM